MKKTVSILLIICLLAGVVVTVINAEDGTYRTASIDCSDLYIGKQWALDNDGTFKEQTYNYGWGYRRNYYTPSAQAGIDVNADQAFDIYNGGFREVIVAVVDTGVDITHEDLAGKIWKNEDEIAGNGKDDDGNGYVDDVYGWNFSNNSNDMTADDSDQHGTHCAGTIIATANNGKGVAGIVQSDNVKLMSVKAIGDNGGSTESVIKAIQYAEANGVSICNLSLGTYINDIALYNTMKNSEMLFVVAAGNDGINIDSRPSYPASYNLDNIITVANLNYDGNLASSSNYGVKSVDLAAPGSAILSTIPGGYTYMTGTSMAAPFVTAACAMVYSYYDDIDLAQVREIILDTAQPLDSLKNAVETGGMLDLGAALSYDTADIPEKEEKIESSGNAPEITAQMENNLLKVSFSDADGDIVGASFMSGERTAESFDGGNNGTAIRLDSSGNAYFNAVSGTYTFYAIDEEGNETVKTIRLTANNPMRNVRYRYPMW